MFYANTLAMSLFLNNVTALSESSHVRPVYWHGCLSDILPSFCENFNEIWNKLQQFVDFNEEAFRRWGYMQKERR